jgi:hypothetical protein
MAHGTGNEIRADWAGMVDTGTAAPVPPSLCTSTLCTASSDDCLARPADKAAACRWILRREYVVLVSCISSSSLPGRPLPSRNLISINHGGLLQAQPRAANLDAVGEDRACPRLHACIDACACACAAGRPGWRTYQQQQAPMERAVVGGRSWLGGQARVWVPTAQGPRPQVGRAPEVAATYLPG